MEKESNKFLELIRTISDEDDVQDFSEDSSEEVEVRLHYRFEVWTLVMQPHSLGGRNVKIDPKLNQVLLKFLFLLNLRHFDVSPP